METNKNNETKKLPWPIKVLLFVAGMVAAAFLSVFMEFFIRSTVFFLIIGIILLLANIKISSFNNETLIYSAGIPLYITGSIYLGVFFSASFPTIGICLLIATIVTIVAIKNNFMRQICILEIFVLTPIIFYNLRETITTIFSIIELFYILIFVATCLFQEKSKVLKKDLSAIRFSSLVCGLILVQIDKTFTIESFYIIYSVTSIIIATYIILQSSGKNKIAAIILGIIVLILAMVDLRIIVSLICIMSGFRIKDTTSVVISLGYLAFGIIQYYYSTTNTLLYKSYSLMAIGAVMLIIFYYITIQEKKSKNKKEISENE